VGWGTIVGKVGIAVFAQFLRFHLPVAPSHTRELPISSFDDASADLGGTFPYSFAHQFFRRECGHFDVDVDPVQQRTGYPREVAPNMGHGAGTDEVRTASVFSIGFYYFPTKA
jgi:hypothetical protein